jgi:glutamate---cysteine ligase / carboxylate-amine ligase
MDAVFADLRTGERTPVRDLLAERLEQLAPIAGELGCGAELREARRVAREGGGAARQRTAAAGDPRAAARWLTDVYVPTPG